MNARALGGSERYFLNARIRTFLSDSIGAIFPDRAFILPRNVSGASIITRGSTLITSPEYKTILSDDHFGRWGAVGWEYSLKTGVWRYRGNPVCLENARWYSGGNAKDLADFLDKSRLARLVNVQEPPRPATKPYAA